MGHFKNLMGHFNHVMFVVTCLTQFLHHTVWHSASEVELPLPTRTCSYVRVRVRVRVRVGVRVRVRVT